MASMTALYTGLSGLITSARDLDVIGNNIANANTTAFKSSTMLFANQFSYSLSQGTLPTTTTGGTNPIQVGLGVGIAGTVQNFTTGSLSPTGDQRDMAINGSGFFVVNNGGTQYYTRAGSFRQDANDNLTNVGGDVLQGYGVDANYNIVPVLKPINIPTGSLTITQATTNAVLGGNLNANGALPTMGSEITLPALTASSGGAPATASSTLVSLADPTNTSNPLIQAGQSIQISGAKVGTATAPNATLNVTSSTTVQDLLNFINQSLGIATTAGPNPDGKTPGASINSAGQIVVDGNVGVDNALSIGPSALTIVNSSGTQISSPFATTQVQAANGESVSTQFVVYDSLGAPVTVNMTMALVSKNNGTGTTWQYFADSADNTSGGLNIGTGTINFDQNGKLVSPATLNLVVNRGTTGAANNESFTINLASSSNALTAQQSTNSTLSSTYQDGAPIGTLQSYSVGANGIITGAFSNGLTRTLGQVAIANFTNPGGLVVAGNNRYSAGINSGTPVVGQPQQNGTGAIVGGSLELSNTDLSSEFINMISASTGYSANSRVITTVDQLMQQLLTLGR